MNGKIRKHLVAYNKKNGWGVEEGSLIETVKESKIIYEEKIQERRHWTDIFVVSDIGGMFIGFDWATGTGDKGFEDIGWEFDPESICEVEPEERTVIVYVRVR